MQSIKKIILFMIPIVILLVIMIFALKKNNDTQEEKDENNIEQTIIDSKIKKVNNASLYFTVSECFNKFIRILRIDINNQSNNEYIPGGEISDSLLFNIATEKEKNNAIYNLLDKIYIQENNINVSNINNNLEFYNIKEYEIKKMYMKDANRIKSFYIYFEYNTNKEVLIQLVLDSYNNTFSVMPLNYINEKVLEDSIELKTVNEIEKNGNNYFDYETVSDEDMAKRYFNLLKISFLKEDIEIYELFDTEYREKRFGSKDKFKEYLEDSNGTLKNIKLSKYDINKYEDYTEYICKDQYDNLYIFKEINTMEYTILLDTYTLENPTFTNSYNSYSDEKKCQMNIDKFFQMINRQDYKTSYNCIADSFKNNYFQNEERFKQYVKQKFFLYNKVSYKNVSDMGNDIYVYTLELSDLTESTSEKKEISLIIRLKEELNFEISFEM